MREIGKFLYAEKNGELVYFEYEGKAVDLSVCDAAAFLRGVAGGYLKFKEENPEKSIAGAVKSINIPIGPIHNGRDYSDAIAKELEKEEPFSNAGALVHGLQIIEDVEKAKKIVEGTNTPVSAVAQKNKEPERVVTIDADCTIPCVVDSVNVEVVVPPKKEVHEVNVPIEAQPASDGWMSDDGNDPVGIGASMADVPVYLTEEEKKAAENEGAPEENNEAPFTEAAPTITAIELTEDALREISMTAAAMEASRLCGVISGNYGDTSVDIIRRNATVPNFLNVYGECLRKVGNAYSLDEIAAALPAQRTWILNNGVSVK